MKLSSRARSVLQSTAPTLLAALALPPPFNVIASAVVSSVLQKYLPEEKMHELDKTGAGTVVMKPADVAETIEKNAGAPELAQDLGEAEVELKKFEAEQGIRFRELDIKELRSRQEFQHKSGISLQVFQHGFLLVAAALITMGVVVVGILVLVFSSYGDDEFATVSSAVFGVLGAIVGFINGIAASIVNFYWGSSESSQRNSEEIASQMQKLGADLGQVAKIKSGNVLDGAQIEKASFNDGAQEARTMDPSKPIPKSIFVSLKEDLTTPHKYFPEGVEWALTQDGVAIESAAPMGTSGSIITVPRIWDNYGDLCLKYSRRYGVPVELIVATIATESSGNKSARRQESRGRESVGLMQTLVSTAREALGDPRISGDDLLDPELSIRAGTAYIAKQYGTTHLDPPKVAAAYNAGSIRRDDSNANRWRMHCYPSGTGQHIDRFVAYFNDCMRVSRADAWNKNKEAVSFTDYF